MQVRPYQRLTLDRFHSRLQDNETCCCLLGGSANYVLQHHTKYTINTLLFVKVWVLWKNVPLVVFVSAGHTQPRRVRAPKYCVCQSPRTHRCVLMARTPWEQSASPCCAAVVLRGVVTLSRCVRVQVSAQMCRCPNTRAREQIGKTKKCFNKTLEKQLITTIVSSICISFFKCPCLE